MGIVDADAHVFETPETWEYLEPNERKYLPRMVEQVFGNERHGLAGNVWSRYWLIEKCIINAESNINPGIDKARRDLADVDGRVAHMDEMGVDVQVIFPSLFLHPYTRNQDLEYALSRSYNRWMGEIWKKGGGRIRWVVVLPILQMDKVLEELEIARDSGACGILMHGLEQDRLITDPYFYPLYEKASELNLAVCVHAGYNSFAFEQLFRGAGGMIEFRYPVIAAFHGLMMKNIPGMFPNLRWGFLEAGAQWIPMAMQDLAVRYRDLLNQEMPKTLFSDRNVYVTCQVDDDIPYILEYTGEDSLVMGTDYGHHDHAADLDAFGTLREGCGIGADVADKILSANPRSLYALD
jgi:aminocarboxymuconate-semialdehyde decarboxylase